MKSFFVQMRFFLTVAGILAILAMSVLLESTAALGRWLVIIGAWLTITVVAWLVKRCPSCGCLETRVEDDYGPDPGSGRSGDIGPFERRILCKRCGRLRRIDSMTSFEDTRLSCLVSIKISTTGLCRSLTSGGVTAPNVLPPEHHDHDSGRVTRTWSASESLSAAWGRASGSWP